MSFRSRMFCLWFLGCLLGRIMAAPPPSVPLLRLETGLHTGPICAMALSRDGRLALTASEDKTARFWELPSGHLLRTFRPAIQEGNTGKLDACALSPDGSLAALGGWTQGSRERSHPVLLVDARSGELLQTVDLGDQVVNFLAFSPDGRRLVAHLGGALGLRVLSIPDGAVLASDEDYDQPSYRGAFDAQGRYAASSDDGFLRLYDAGFRRLLKSRSPGKAPFGLAFSPDGTLLALGHADGPEVEVLRASDLTLAYRPAPGSAALGLVAWSPDGGTLYAAGGEDFGPAANPLRHWSLGGRGPGAEVPLARATVSELLPLPGGDLAFAAQDPVWGVVDGAGRPRCLRTLQPMDLRQARERFQVDPDGTGITLPQLSGNGVGLAFSVADLEVRPDTAARGLAVQAPGPQVAGWKDGLRPTCDGRPLDLQEHETSRCLACLPRGDGFLLGTDWWIRDFDAGGHERWRTPVPAPVWGVGLGAGGRVFVAMLADGSFRWHRTADGRPLFTLFVAPDQRWVLWTPSGYFATSIGGEGLVGWQVNRSGQGADFFPVSHFRDRFYQPRLMGQLLATLDEADALGRLGGGHLPALAPAELPPVVRILSPAEGTNQPGGTTTFELALRTRGPARPLATIRATINGERVALAGEPRLRQQHSLAEGEERIYSLQMDLPIRDTQVGFQAELAGGQVSEWVAVSLQGPPAAQAVGPGPVAPRLRVLAVGVSTYAEPKLNLRFSAKDAQDVADFFRGQEGRLFSKVEVTLLTDAQATGKAVLQGLEELRDQARPGDVTLVFLSSHGGIGVDRTSYYLLPYDFGAGSWGVDGPDIKARIEATQGKVLLLMDTCHSGNVLGEGKMRGLDDFIRRARFINELLQTRPGTLVICSSTGSQFSMEAPVWQNGAFTKALREGLGGAADRGRTGRVTTDMLDAWLRQRVAELTQGRQTPVAARTEAAQGFPLAMTP